MTVRTDRLPPPSPRTATGAVDLPLRVPLIHGETTASFLARTAAANGLSDRALLKPLHQGRLALRAGELRPAVEEVFLARGSLPRLAAMVDRPVEQLERALPDLRAEHAVPAPGPRARVVAWPQGFGQRPLPACPLCMEPGAWLAAQGQRWRPCGCGRRWMIGDRGGYLVNTTPVPTLGRAWLRHRALVHRLGPEGDALVADAHQVTLWWWAHRAVARGLWREREDALEMGRGGRRQAAPVVVYPEAVLLAEAMWAWERQRGKPGLSEQTWLDDVADLLGFSRERRRRDEDPLRYWLEQHQATEADAPRAAAGRGRSAAERRWDRLPVLHQREVEPGLFRAGSCLRWVYGKPLTTVEVCPRCGGRNPACRWEPSPTCTGPPG